VADDYRQHAGTGSFIIVDRLSNATVAAGMILGDSLANDDDAIYSAPAVPADERARRFGQRAGVVSIDAGEVSTSLLYTLEKRLFERGRLPLVVLQSRLPEGITSAAALVGLLRDQGFIVLTDARIEGAFRIAGDDTASLQLDANADLSAQIDTIVHALVQAELI
jgi:bifunctional enzyme CysN/CysC